MDQIAFLTPFVWIFLWLFPILLFTRATSSLITLVTDSPLAVPIGVLLWYMWTLGGSMRVVSGDYGWHFIPRHNSPANEAYFAMHKSQLLLNRGFWLLLSLLVAGFAIYLLHRKRKGYYGKNR